MKIGVLGESELVNPLLGQSVLRSVIPDAEIHSHVMSPEVLEGIDSVISDIVMQWGLPKATMTEYEPTILGVKEQNYSHVILCHPNLKTHVRALGKNCHVLAEWDQSPTQDLTSRSLEKLVSNDIHIEFARVAGKFIKFANVALGTNVHLKAKAFIPINEQDCELAFVSAQFEESVNAGIILDADLRAKRSYLKSPESTVFEYDPKNFQFESFRNLPTGSVLVPAYEVSHPEKILLSKNWFDFVRFLMAQNSIHFITAPRFVRERRLADSYLVLGLSREVRKIGL